MHPRLGLPPLLRARVNRRFAANGRRFEPGAASRYLPTLAFGVIAFSSSTASRGAPQERHSPPVP